MRIPSLRVTAVRLALALAVLIGSVILISAPKPPYSTQDKAYFADPNLVAFVRPGLVLKILSAEVAGDGTIKARVKITDPKGLPLDRDGIMTPGVVSLSFIAGWIPKDQSQYTAYTTRAVTSPITNVTATQAGSDSGGTFEKVADGEYVYTFKTKAPPTFDKTATHSIGVYSSRDLREFDLDRNFADAVFTFVPDGSQVTKVRDVIKTSSCNKCHTELALHGGPRRSVELCVLCHTPQTTDPDTGNTVNFPVMIHKIHMGENLPSVKAGKKYQIIGNQQSVHDYSTVAFPADARNCQFCHESGNGAAQENAWLKPNRAACGACHDDVNFATGENHVDLPQVSDNQCSSCHQPQGELEFDASIKNAHIIPERSPSLPGIVVDNINVTDGVAGKKPTVTLTLKDKAGTPIPLDQMNRLNVVLAGPTTDYGATNFGVSTPGYVSEDATKGSCDGGGTCTYTFQRAIPADAKGTFAIGVEARRLATLNPGTRKEIHTEYGAINKVVYFSVDGSSVQPRRQVVSVDKCNQCHSFLSLHGENRNQTEMCVICHNPNNNDKARRPADKMPAQSINFALMIHKIHTGEHLKEEGREYTVYGFYTPPNPPNPIDFTEVRYPSDRRFCEKCHVNGSQQLPLKGERLQVSDPRGYLNPVGAIAGACTACHVSLPTASHALANTTTLGESCVACHGNGYEFNVDKVHAR